MNIVECRNLTKSYGGKNALNNISFTIEKDTITGIIGRNGAGKTTLLKILAGFQKHTAGNILVFNENPFNNLQVSQNMIFIDDQMTMPPSLNLKEILFAANRFYENWDMELAKNLFEYFSFSEHQHHLDLSKGLKSTFNMIIGLSARCPLTIFDEPTTGMDAAARKDFYRVLLKDYLDYPRTILLSSHLLSELEDILEDILLLKIGEKHLHLSVDELRQQAIGISGDKELIEKLTKDQEIYHKQSIGAKNLYVVVNNTFSALELEKAKQSGLEITTVSPEDLCVYLTNPTQGGIDDVFSKS